jgi:hypothetical protein
MPYGNVKPACEPFVAYCRNSPLLILVTAIPADTGGRITAESATQECVDTERSLIYLSHIFACANYGDDGSVKGDNELQISQCLRRT